jgi:hypothetical protein
MPNADEEREKGSSHTSAELAQAFGETLRIKLPKLSPDQEFHGRYIPADPHRHVNCTQTEKKCPWLRFSMVP